ncbi:MAG: cytochrome c biogenesis protein CcsA [Propionibacteriaceae bacterium]|nr:cytochrome c biogenesis protein CcsA [Propionibacteriaceae bacterium]
MLQFAEYLLTAALIFVGLALVTALVLLSSRGRVTRAKTRKSAVTRAKVAVGAGAGGGVGAGSEVHVDDEAVNGADGAGVVKLDQVETMGATAQVVDGADGVDGVDGAVLDAEPDTGSSSSQAHAGRAPGRSVSVGVFSTGFTIVALILVTAYLGVRIALTGHGPFTNMHEFAVSFAWGILVAYLVTYWRFKLRMLSLVVLPVVGSLLVYALSIDSGVEPLVPALQNNLLLSLHVGFAILSYGAACVSFGAAIIYLIWPKLKLKTPRMRFDEVGYKAAVVAFPLMTAMILLGALWANIAWGRYWGWDPKETAALVTWLLYAAFLHARVVRGWRGTKAAWLLVIGFAAVIFAYFGNYFFGGLHSYQ